MPNTHRCRVLAIMADGHQRRLVRVLRALALDPRDRHRLVQRRVPRVHALNHNVVQAEPPQRVRLDGGFFRSPPSFAPCQRRAARALPCPERRGRTKNSPAGEEPACPPYVRSLVLGAVAVLKTRLLRRSSVLCWLLEREGRVLPLLRSEDSVNEPLTIGGFAINETNNAGYLADIRPYVYGQGKGA
jgi:hypothetical protein